MGLEDRSCRRRGLHRAPRPLWQARRPGLPHNQIWRSQQHGGLPGWSGVRRSPKVCKGEPRTIMWTCQPRPVRCRPEGQDHRGPGSLDADLDSKIAAEEKKLEQAEEHFKSEVEKLQATYEKLSKEKDDTIAAVKKGGLGMLKSVRAHKKSGDKKEL